MLHFNFYVIFLVIFTLGGVVTTVWGWMILAKGRRIRSWPCVEGAIEKSERGVEHHDLLPEIVFSYAIDGKRYTRAHHFPASVTPSKEFTDSYLDKYPVGAKVTIKYDPTSPDRASLEGDAVNDDWLVFWWGIGMIAIGVVCLMAGI